MKTATLLEQTVLSDPPPDGFEAWLLERCLASGTASTGAMRATEWGQFRDWLMAGAPSEDRTLE